jgi:ATP-dependent DNA helicase RecG
MGIGKIIVARVMNKLNFIEKWGTGINRILTSCELKGLKRPEIIEMNDFLRLNYSDQK